MRAGARYPESVDLAELYVSVRLEDSSGREFWWPRAWPFVCEVEGGLL